MGTRSWRAAVVVGASVLLLAACTTAPEPAPSPSPPAPPASSPTSTEPVGVRVAVVLPLVGEAPLTTAGSREAAEGVAADHRDELGEFRIVAPDGATFVGDIATVLAEQGYDLVCLVGDTAVDVAMRVAAGFPATRFCAIPGPTVAPDEDLPDNVLVVAHRMEEVGYLAGVAAAQVPVPSPAPDAGAPAPPPAGFIGDPSRPTTPQQRAAFEAGLAAGLGRAVAPRVAVSAAGEEVIAQLAREQFDAGIPVVFTAAGAADEAVLEAAGDRGGLVVLHRDRARFEGDPPAEVLVWFLVDVGRGLELAVTRLLDGWEGGVASFGLADGAITVQTGGAPRSAAVRERVDAVATELREGRTTVPTP